MSSKDKVRKLSGIRESLVGLIKAIDKMQSPPTPYDTPYCPKDEPEHNYVHQRYLSGALAFDEHCPKCVKDKKLTDQWQTHKATKVVESGWFCDNCGGTIMEDGMWTIHSCHITRGIK